LERIAGLGVLLLTACSRVAEPDSAIFDSSTVSDTSSKDAGVATDSAGANAACGVALVGSKWSPTCEAWAESHCCSGLDTCAKDDICAGWVRCINACAGSSDPICQKKCGPIRLGFQSAYNCIFDIADGAPRPPPDCAYP